jgi:hypothetical protein
MSQKAGKMEFQRYWPEVCRLPPGYSFGLYPEKILP